MDITILVRKWGVRLLKIALFLLMSVMVGRSLGPSRAYINYDVAMAICVFIYGDANAETMYETYTNLDILTVLTLTTVIYLLTMKLLKKIRNT